MRNEELNQMTITTDINQVIKKNLLLIIILVTLSTLVSVFYAKFIIKPKYQSKADVMIQVPASSGEGFDYFSAQRLVLTMTEFMSKEIVVEKAIADSNLSISKTKILNGLDITSNVTSIFINISFTSENLDETGLIVNAIIDSALNLINEDASFASLKNKLIRLSYADKGVYSSPDSTLCALVGLCLGLGLSAVYIILMMFLNNKFKKYQRN